MRFQYHNPTRVVFGAGVSDGIGAEVAAIGRHALVVAGGASARKTGLLDRVLDSIRKAGATADVFAGVEPNPRLSTVKRGAGVARQQGSDVVVAVGGGSVMDAAKVTPAAVFYEGDPWAMFWHGGAEPRAPERALPIVTVPTLAATGSETNSGAVVTNEATTEKSYVSADCLYPRVAVIDPALTATVPPDQTAFGIADIVSHVTESYFNGIDGTPLQDRMAEGVVQIVLDFGPRAVANGADIEARTHLQWASVVALNGSIQAGCAAPFPVHGMEHVLSAHHDVPHGAGLAILTPAWMRWAAHRRPAKLAGFARRVLGVPAGDADLAAALAGADRLEAFYRSIGAPVRLSQVGIPADGIPRYAADAVRVAGDGQRLWGRPALTAADVAEVLRGAA
ncbi:MAG: iron-containing alcohol dehydrogenase [Deltaproteobacteria bacterium]|nr:iron-containing alcohol dehydrogenase [Deltaproteobacteria bacterium]